MNHFSDKEYHLLKTEALDNKNSISRYIGYIITVTGVSGLIKFYFDNEVGPTGSVVLFFLTLVVLTLLFEVVWYKFKSHNRLVGYIQVLMQEIHAIPYGKMTYKNEKGNKVKDTIKDKNYIKNWKRYNVKQKDKLLTDFYAWEFAMARYHENVLFEKENKIQERINNYCDATDKGNYIFSLPDSWMPYTETYDGRRKNGETCDRDVEFFETIILPIYFKDNAISIRKGLFRYLGFLLRDKSKSKPLKQLDVENRYLIYGWEYPRKITQIAFIAASLIYIFLSIFILRHFHPINPLNYTESLTGFETLSYFITVSIPLIFFIASTWIMILWIKRYVKGLVELLYGKFSINYYSWQFFVFRIQMLNNKTLIPVFYSRAYLRYFKCKTYHKFLLANKKCIKAMLKEEQTQVLEAYIKRIEQGKAVSAKEIFRRLEAHIKTLSESRFPNTKKNDTNKTEYLKFLETQKEVLLSALKDDGLKTYRAYKKCLRKHKDFGSNQDIVTFHNRFKKIIKAKLEQNVKLDEADKDTYDWYSLKAQLKAVAEDDNITLSNKNC
ncbi:MAG: hypothetical protein KDD26_11575 [Winogradskyella sp.]|nr:hypothetical protein [Winogradskyella sp.]